MLFLITETCILFLITEQINKKQIMNMNYLVQEIYDDDMAPSMSGTWQVINPVTFWANGSLSFWNLRGKGEFSDIASYIT